MALSVAVPSVGASGNPITNAKRLYARLSLKLANEEAQSEALGQQYDGDVAALHSLNASIARLQAKVVVKQAALDATSKTLVTSLVETYVDSASSGQGIPLLNLNVGQADAQKVYENEILGNINTLEWRLSREKASLNRTLRDVSNQRVLAGNEVHSIRGLIFQNRSNVSATQATLSSVSSTLVARIVNYEVSVGVADARHHDSSGVEQAVAAATAVGGQDAGNRVISAVAAITVTTNQVTGTAAGSKEGLAAVHAAESQIGVPYVWGGESPGYGFDCSGLTEWSWAKAGYSIPRTAAEQYDALQRVPLSDLRPGDLLFYYNLDGDNTVDHVVMYVGSGPYGVNTIIAAAHTGTNIGFEPLFTYGLVGAGRP